jgi:AMP-polyphosphate phosphotransferase
MPSLTTIDLDVALGRDEYRKASAKNHKRLVALQQRLYRERIPVALAFEGWDAAGKGGAIRRLLKHIDPRGYHVYAIVAPTQEELDHHYLRRFWLRLPSRGRIAIFDRSWYGRVLVERVEGFATKPEWKRAYEEINQFEQQLTADGCLVIKVFMHISKDEQKRRFEARAANPLKTWKLTSEDHRNRKKWHLYEEAIEDMLAKTHSDHAPWHVIPGNDKYYARIAVQQCVIDAFEQRLQEKKALKAAKG